MKIVSIVGARPQFIKAATVSRIIRAHPEVHEVLLHTGQHYDEKMSALFFEELKIPKPDISLNIGSASHAVQVAHIMEKFDSVCDTYKPEAVLVVGDVNSTMACTLVAAKKGIKTIHVEAGIRSMDKSMPEEINRMVTDSITDFLLPPSADAVENLLKEGHLPDQIYMVGNIMIDTLLWNQDGIKASKILNDLGLTPKSYAVMTLHRPSNVDDPAAFLRILDALEVIQKDIKIVFPVHPRTNKMIPELKLTARIEALKNIIFCEPLGYFDFSKLVSDSLFALTDSGGIQEETTVYGIPCITLRENTERPITITEGTNELAGTDTEKIIYFAQKIMRNEWKKGRIPALWDGKTAERILDFLEKKLV